MTHLDGFTPWPEDLADRYRREGYWLDVPLGDLPRRWAERDGGREALVAGDERLSYAAMAERADALALGLLDAGIGPGAHVVVQLPNGLDFVLLCFALYRIGARPILALPAHREHEIGHLIRLGGASAYAVPGDDPRFDFLDLARRMREAHPDLAHVLVGASAPAGSLSIRRLLDRAVTAADRARLDGLRPSAADVALFLLSGGTTGLPKLIPRTHRDYHYNFRRSAELCGFDARTRYLVVLPVAHNFPYGSPGLLGAFERGGTVVLAPSPNPRAAFPLIARERITATAVVPAVAMSWMEDAPGAGADLSSLGLLQVGGARFNPEAARRVRPVLGCALQQVFGMAEGLLNFTRLDEPEDWAIETQGRPMCPADEARVVDEDGRDVPDGTPGELLTRGPYTLRGYFRAPEHNARAFTPDGFYRTGDVVVRDPASGNFRVEGRAKDLINRGGEKISAEEVENVMLAHPAVRQAAAVAYPDPRLGERVCACAVLRPGARLTLEELRAFFAARGVAAFKFPERLELLDDLPVTSVGKIDKKTLRERVARGS